MSEGRSKILVVDDDDDILSMISAVLRKGYEVVTASDGSTALSMIEHHDIAGIIADYMMPGLTGVELLDRCHELRPAAARILITASDRINVLRDAVNRARVHRFLSKPLRLTELPVTLNEAIRAARLEAENARLVIELALKNIELNRTNERLEADVRQRTHELQIAVQQLGELALRDGLRVSTTTAFYRRRSRASYHAQRATAMRWDCSSSTSTTSSSTTISTAIRPATAYSSASRTY